MKHCMIEVVDDRGQALRFPRAPRRIVSLVPSETHDLFALGAGERLVGATDYCIEPEAAKHLPRVGGTKDADAARIAALAPELVLANQEENARALAAQLAARGIPLFISFPRTVAAGVAHLGRLARILDVQEDAHAQAALRAAETSLRDARARLAEDEREGTAPLDTFAPIWMEPLMTISGDTFVSDALRLAGARNVFAARKRRYPLAADLGRAEPLDEAQVGARDTRYPRITLAELVLRDPALVLLPDEPHPFGARELQIFGMQTIRAARAGNILFCSGRDLMWPGARGAAGLSRLRALVDAARARLHEPSRR